MRGISGRWNVAETTPEKVERLWLIVQTMNSKQRDSVLCWLIGYCKHDAEFAKGLEHVLRLEFPNQFKAVPHD